MERIVLIPIPDQQRQGQYSFPIFALEVSGVLLRLIPALQNVGVCKDVRDLEADPGARKCGRLPASK